VVSRTDPLGRPAGRTSFFAPPGPLRLRLTALNAAGGRVEADDQIFEVPDFTAGQLLVTSPAVYRGRTARDMQTIRDAEAPVPAVTRAFSRTERLLLRFGALGDPAAPPKVAVRLLNRAGDFIAALPAPTPLADGRFESQVVLSGLPPGDYLVELAAAVGDQSVRTLLALRVSG
jgi:hypothetical protein